MKFWAIGAAAAAAIGAFVPGHGHAAVEYVKVCSSFGAGWEYIPGTDTCVKTATGDTARNTEDGVVYSKTPLAASVDDLNTANAALQGQVNTVSTTTDNLSQQVNALAVSNAVLNARIDQVFDAIDKANEGSAVMGALPMPYIEQGHNFALAGNFAQFESSGAFGLGGAMRVNSNLTFNGSVAVGAQQGTVGGRVGFNLSW
ncbi:porin [Kaistia dalseonensis]|uniref:Porin n=1 Tax=Kaistia dalseonensis TaxID=410840 RepID=A0ABU0H380_9HYPH|nr:porin [Kaistia dalseonensis]MCX5494162.1 porin [Kaistia dalseonensis]MDQ0436741.1 hypothetical protein [Kaistia dalseonensis]